jgi:hypothetical protein
MRDEAEKRIGHLYPKVAVTAQMAQDRRGDESYFALAFANDSGGYELRNPYFKGTLNAKDITVIPGDRDRVLVFEGFFDFLTAVTMSAGLPRGTVLVLNSVSTQEKAAERIRDIKPRVVELYRDRDPPGEQLLAFFRQALYDTEIIDQSDRYIGHKDLNDWHATHNFAEPPSVQR